MITQMAQIYDKDARYASEMCIRDSPWAIAPSMMLRWEIDLSPGTVISPFKFFALAIVLTLINDIPEFLQ